MNIHSTDSDALHTPVNAATTLSTDGLVAFVSGPEAALGDSQEG